jgi:hypothetical protein
MVWMKCRDNGFDHQIYDTERGVTNHLRSNTIEVEGTQSTSLTSFNSDGFTIGSLGWINFLNNDYVSWTFRKAPRFFDVVTYTGDGVAGREIAHDLGVAPGMIIVKQTDNDYAWYTYHRSTGSSAYLTLNTTEAAYSSTLQWDGTDPTDTHFTLGGHITTNYPGKTHIAYIFAHDPVGANDDGMIACGSYTGNGSTDGPEIDLGWEPQYILLKCSTNAGEEWQIYDSMRGIAGVTDTLLANRNYTETNSTAGILGMRLLANGFKMTGINSGVNGNGRTYIYMAIRGPMMKEPEAGTEVFDVDFRNSNAPSFTSGFPVDMAFYGETNGNKREISTRMLQGTNLVTSSTAAENTTTGSAVFDYMDGWDNNYGVSSVLFSYMFKRAKGFFDVVAYTGNSNSTITVNHSLGVAPEMVWVKTRSGGANWLVGQTMVMPYGITASGLNLNLTDAVGQYFFMSTPTSTEMELHANINSNTSTYIAYLFASLDGVSKVGSYTGNGSSQNIACGFSAGIVAGNDPHLSLNTTAAEVTSNDSIDPYSTGFTVNQVAATNINVSSATYIFLAIA